MGETSGRIEILPDPAALAHHVAEWMTAAALAAHGTFRVSLSGGSTPKTLYGLLASDEFRGRFPWQRVSWYWGDERFVPYDHPESNYRMTREAMLAKAPVPPENIHPVPTDGTPEDAARRYERTLQAGLRRGDAGSGAAAVRHHPARPRSRRPYGFAAAGRAGAGGAQALGRRRVAWAARGPHHHDLSGDREQPACRISGDGSAEGAHLAVNPRRGQRGSCVAGSADRRTCLVRRPSCDERRTNAPPGAYTAAMKCGACGGKPALVRPAPDCARDEQWRFESKTMH